jgi:hypothetical protein
MEHPGFILLEMRSIFGIEIFESESFFNLLIRFSMNLFAVFILARILYYSINKRKDYLFTYLLISSIVFLLCFMLGNVKLQIGFALGLFAIFGILRYRTATIPIKEMTYLFIIIGLSVINSLFNKKVSWAEVIFTNMVIISLAFLLEKVWLLKHESSRLILLEDIELIKPDNYEKMLQELRSRTGLNIHRAEIGKIDFMRDMAQVVIFFYEKKFTGRENPDEEEYISNDSVD